MNIKAAASNSVWALALALSAGLATASLAAPANSPEQARLEARAERIFQTASVQQALGRLAERLGADPHAAEVGSPERVHRDAEEIAFGAVEDVLNQDTARPFLYWFYRPEHRSGGMRVPGSKYALSNPDTVFRYVPIDPGGRYVIRGRFGPRRSSYLSLHLGGGQPGAEGESREIAVLFDSNLAVAKDGRFEVTVDARPSSAAGPNHIQTTPQANRLIVRDTLADWARELPTTLTVERIDTAAAPAARSDAGIAGDAVAAIDRAGGTVLAFRDRFFLAAPPNTLPVPAKHPTGVWAVTLEASFALADDEALVFTLDRLHARYLGVQTADMLTGTIWPALRPSTLNAAQARPNRDGTITFVLAPSDPRVGNWIDTAGLAKGLIMVRWQGLPTPLPDLSHGVRGVRVVRLAELPQALAPTAEPVPAGERSRQLARRRRDYQRRYAGW
jgi:hypothetical protein